MDFSWLLKDVVYRININSKLILKLAINVMLWLQDGITWLLLPSKSL